MRKLSKYIILIVLVVFNQKAFAQNINELKQEINRIIKDKSATVGVSITGFDGRDTLTVNGDGHFPMLSVFKYPIALTVLHLADQKDIKLSQKIKLTKKDLIPNTYSPIRDRFPNGVTLKVSELINYSVSLSDNIAADILLDLVEGTKSVEEYLGTSGIQNVSIRYNEAEQHENWENQYQRRIETSIGFVFPEILKMILKATPDSKIRPGLEIHRSGGNIIHPAIRRKPPESFLSSVLYFPILVTQYHPIG